MNVERPATFHIVVGRLCFSLAMPKLNQSMIPIVPRHGIGDGPKRSHIGVYPSVTKN